MAAPPRAVGQRGRSASQDGRRLGYAMVLPAVLVILLIGLFPLVYTLLVSFQNITMTGGGHLLPAAC